MELSCAHMPMMFPPMTSNLKNKLTQTDPGDHQVWSVSVERHDPRVLSAFRHRHLPPHWSDFKNIWSPCFIFLWLKSQRGFELSLNHFSGLSIRRCVACSGSGCVSSYCKVTCHLCHLVTWSPVTCSHFSPAHLFRLVICSVHLKIIDQLLKCSLCHWSPGQPAMWSTDHWSPARSLLCLLWWAATAFLHRHLYHPILIGSLQEEMVLAFLFLPYLAGYLLLHLNIQVKIQTPLYKFNVELMLLFLPYPLDIMQLHISR